MDLLSDLIDDPKIAPLKYRIFAFLIDFIRHLFDPIEMMFLVGLIVAVSNEKKQRIGDLVAKTIVVMDRK